MKKMNKQARINHRSYDALVPLYLTYTVALSVPLPLHTIGLLFFFFNDTATTEIYTLSLHDALPIYCAARLRRRHPPVCARRPAPRRRPNDDRRADRKSTRLNSSHSQISYAVFCLKKKNKICRYPSTD